MVVVKLFDKKKSQSASAEEEEKIQSAKKNRLIHQLSRSPAYVYEFKHKRRNHG